MRLHQLLTGLVITIVAACGNAGDDGSVVTTPASTSPPGSPPAVGAPSSTAPVVDAPVPPGPTLPPTAANCFKGQRGVIASPEYDKFKPTIAASCAGTHHQTIKGVERVVFLGDSVTFGTPPTPANQIYRARVYEGVKKRFGNNVTTSDCSGWGTKTDDFLGGNKELTTCFPGASDPKRTLVVFTVGGNDIAAWAKSKLSTADAMVAADAAADQLRAAIDWLQAPGRFPNGVNIVFANVYEYTDTSGDLASCPAATASGFSGTWPAGAPAVVHFMERYMEIATQTKTDMVFLLEAFCGHGYKRNDASLQCYRGPGAELWFDLTCYHPSPVGHGHIADLFLSVIDGT